MSSVETRSPATGRVLKEDDSYVNVANLFETLAANIATIAAAQAPPTLELLTYESIPVGVAAVPLTTIPATANGVLLTTKGDIRWRPDAAPTQGGNGEGYLWRDTDGPLHLLHLSQPELTALRFVRGSGSNSTLYVVYVKMTP